MSKSGLVVLRVLQVFKVYKVRKEPPELRAQLELKAH
jgi:hypothetical protein